MKDFNKDNRFGGNKGGDSRGGNRFGKPAFGKPSFGPKPMFEATCADCGKKCEVPFRPTGERPVYCRDCFSKSDHAPAGTFVKREFSGERFSGERPAPRPIAPTNQLDDVKRQLDKINSKLDQLIQAARPVAPAPVAVPVAVKSIVAKPLVSKPAVPKAKAVKKPVAKSKKKK
jgi:CxxC-x17-CxxC domain-containing protein